MQCSAVKENAADQSTLLFYVYTSLISLSKKKRTFFRYVQKITTIRRNGTDCIVVVDYTETRRVLPKEIAEPDVVNRDSGRYFN